MLKVCCKCDQYAEHNLRSNGNAQAYCVTCMRAYNREHYAKHKDTHNKRRAENNKRWRQKVRKLIAELKSVPCTDCGQTYHPCVMDFDHLEGHEKIGNVATLALRAPLEEVLAEIEKCEVVCANCHRMRTWLRMQGTIEE